MGKARVSVTQIQPRLVSSLKRTGERWGGKGSCLSDTDPAHQADVTTHERQTGSHSNNEVADGEPLKHCPCCVTVLHRH